MGALLERLVAVLAVLVDSDGACMIIHTFCLPHGYFHG